MKYMGSKRTMLENGLGQLLGNELECAQRFVDLFTGSGAVAMYVAQQHSIPVLAFDLQAYSVVLAGAVVERRTGLDWRKVWNRWLRRAEARLRPRQFPVTAKLTRAIVDGFRRWCADTEGPPVTRAYGGYYFSPWQAGWIDALRATLPTTEPARTVALAALIQAASQCAAAPGHTAQPFQPTRTGKPYLEELWRRDVAQRTRKALSILADRFARRSGRAVVSDANHAAHQLRPGDLAFIDPPYSDVQYSRFYHVLETIACGLCGDVSGVGRYPTRERRPQSRYSLRTESAIVLDDLLKTVAGREAGAILTFPDHDCSNGLSGEAVRDIARKFFRVREMTVESNFSTLGGRGGEGRNEAGRAPLHKSRELILTLKPR